MELKNSLPDSPEELWNFSPLKYIKHVSTPLLIMHGEQDLRCPVEQGNSFLSV
ncbi:S9 family peptidase [Sinobaca sp. H24]|uniref:alpha/beta hydrolase family protein n=1 Tax=Sinobaca sp. H24 TaxID=2923376 RepID=UPI00207A7DD0|nr:prolyl oligopeptidase family serine peptidase [Sinobaca sp. H24]